MRPCYIYGLCEPTTGRIRYIGKTVDLEKRYRLHLSRARKHTTPHVYAWLRSVLESGREPQVQVLAVVAEKDWPQIERLFIAHTPGLTNSTSGGEGIDPEVIAAARAGTYIVTHPDGTDEQITNLTAFCRERGMQNTNAFKVLKGERTHVAGYRFRHVGEPPREDPPARYRATFPDGRVEEFRELKPWAEAQGVKHGKFARVACGQRPHYRGIRIERLDAP